MNWLPPEFVSVLHDEKTTAHRVCSDAHQWIERFGGTAVLSVKDRARAEELLPELDDWAFRAGVDFSRIYVRLLVRQPREKDQPLLIRGDAEAAETETVQENGLTYEVDFASGYSVGLFCDQRHNRLHLRALAPKRVLNTFAYTCAFSVAAAVEGAETLSIDLSKLSLKRGRRNLELNGQDPKNHRFMSDDVLAVLPRLANREEKFDAIILDPPTFGRSSPKRSFRAERDYEGLIELAMQCAASKASILLSTNCSSLTVAKLQSMAARVARGKAEFRRAPDQPDFPRGSGSATIWMRRTK